MLEDLCISRRTALQSALLAGISIDAKNKESVRIIHLTDLHLFNNHLVRANCLRAVNIINSLQPDAIFTGGDHIMDASRASLADAKEQWQFYHDIMNRVEVHQYGVIGNHDIFDCSKDSVQQELKLSNRYYSVDVQNWHFILLDNVQIKEKSYLAALDVEQLDWLRKDLEDNKDKPTVIISHIPILSACVFFDPDVSDRDFSERVMLRDVKGFLPILEKHSVKALLSGHIHLRDEVTYKGMKFICGGAVCGNWWSGDYQGFPPSFMVLDLHNDGTFEYHYVNL